MHAVCHDVFDNSYLYYESIHKFILQIAYLYCIVSFHFDDVPAALLMYSTYIHCLHCVGMLLTGAWLF